MYHYKNGTPNVGNKTFTYHGTYLTQSSKTNLFVGSITILGAMKNLFTIIFIGLCVFFCLVEFEEANAQLLSPDPLFDAAEQANYADAEKALLAGASPNVRGKNMSTALMAAARAGSVDLVKLILRHKAIPNLADSEGNTALIYAALSNFEEIVDVLIESGASINRANNQGKTALMRAAEAGSNISVAALLSAGADFTLTDFTGRTAFDLARENRQNSVLITLRKAKIKQ